MTRHLITVVRGLGEGEGGDNDFVFVKTDLNEMMLSSRLCEDKKVYIWFNIKGITWQSSESHSKEGKSHGLQIVRTQGPHYMHY